MSTNIETLTEEYELEAFHKPMQQDLHSSMSDQRIKVNSEQ
jgi:hypothetical protein